MKSDYSEYLMDPAHLENEEAEWARQGFYKKNAQYVKDFMEENDLTTVIEFGCGTGLVACEIDSCDYVGIDKNPRCIARAKERCTKGVIECMDMREVGFERFDIACSFAFLKHFGLHEWDNILNKMISGSAYGLFAVAISEHDLDDGTDFPHTSVTLEHLDLAVAAAGHKILKTEHQADSATGYEMLVWTERV